MRTATTVVVTLAVAAAAAGAAGLAYIHSGRYDVAATRPHGALSRWVLETTQENSVRARAERVDEPPPLTAERARHGARHYAQTCAVCHGAPGLERSEIGKGITPTPPDLAEAAGQWSAQELFWIVKHGIKFAGMPAFGPTHGDDELWSIVALLQRLPDMSPPQYQEMAGPPADRQAQDGHDGHGRHGG